jgi:phage shock protein E
MTKRSLVRIFVVILLWLLLPAIISGCEYITGAALATSATFPPPSTPAAAESVIKDVTPQEANELLIASSALIHILDVRTPEEFAAGHLIGAMNIDFQAPDFRANIAILDKNATYLVYCRTGVRSAAASQVMAELGFKDIYNMTGGFTDWLAAGLPFQK